MSPLDARDVALARKVWSLSSSRRKNRKTAMPFTVSFLQRWAKALGYPMGEKRAAAAIRELRRQKVLQTQGRYRSRTHGFWVVTYQLPLVSSSVRKIRAVKTRYTRCDRRNWWKHSLFGTPDGRRPP